MSNKLSHNHNFCCGRHSLAGRSGWQIDSSEWTNEEPCFLHMSQQNHGQKMKLLLSTFSCFPSKTSEAGNAWRLINDLLHKHEIWAVTERQNAERINQHLKKNPMPGFHPVYFELSYSWRNTFRDRRVLESIYYHQWQEKLAGIVLELHRRVGFDVAHHVTFGRYWSPSGLRILNIPFIWGPVGAAETPPRSFVKELPPRARMFEWLRDTVRNYSKKSSSLHDTARAATIGIGVTNESCEALRNLGVRRVEQMPQAALTNEELQLFESFPPPPPGPFRAICMGRLLHWKGFHLAIRAFAEFAKSSHDAELWLINDGPYRNELEKVAAESGVQSRIHFFGHLKSYSDVLQKLAESHVLIHPALHEGFGNVCLEALAAGRPVTCLDIGGPASQITPETGFAAPATNPTEAIATMSSFLTRLSENRVLLAEMSVKARARVREKFTMQIFSRTINSLYDQVKALKG
jgi:glycosyltransferase involved in cell wall biosynthesis